MFLYGHSLRKIYFTNHGCANEINLIFKIREDIDIKKRKSFLLIKNINTSMYNEIESTIETFELLLKSKSENIEKVEDIMLLIINYIRRQVSLLVQSADFFQFNLSSVPCTYKYSSCSSHDIMPIYFIK